jgi:hypothetical protein
MAKAKTISKNAERLKSFTKYCKDHPDERFFQALRNWLKVARVEVVTIEKDFSKKTWEDTFYWE